MRQHGQRVEKMMAHHGERFANCGQVIAAIPFGEQCHVREQPIERSPRQRKLQLLQAALERSAWRHAVFLDGCRPLFKCTSNSEIAAGVMPEMRDAWPTVSGLCRFSFCWT